MSRTDVRERLITIGSRMAGSFTGRLASRQNTIPPANPRIVLIRRCCLGDVLETTPLLSALRKHYPQARIDYAVEPWAQPALAGNPDVSHVVAPIVGSLRQGRYDVAITLERSPLAGMLPWLAGIPIRVGLNSEGRGFAHNLRVACPPRCSEAELYLECGQALDVPVADARAKFCLTDHDADRARQLLTGAGVEGRPITLAPGGGVNPRMSLAGKRWPPERFADLAGRLLAETGAPVVLVGSETDAVACAEVAGNASFPLANLAGQTSFSQLAAIIARSRLFVSNDSAPLHLAAAVGTPFVGIFGPSDPVRHRPYGRGEIVAAPVPRGAYRNGFTALDCIRLVPLEQVLEACVRLLASDS